ncbi:hypothetical protein ES319_D09G151600v1 [Gossypium barbadense]|uniref:Phthiocerol/phthiodiolone dimycocerosyl transferase C-terminal domain-containing protein n=1 Tax=Gossypium barbadense TaxID=3634 RepID=A0A5J5Q5Q1_GOSBA|nr:hypothetical protein ES319_D09G151600v1 [Gossypium barbadense]
MSESEQTQTQTQNPDPKTPEPKVRAVGVTEYSWCRAVPGGTGITVLSLLLSNVPDISFLEALLCRLQVSHPILRSRVRFDASCNTFYFVTPSNPHVQIQSFDLQSTSHILQSSLGDSHIDSHHVLLEHELNRNSWNRTDGAGDGDQADWDVFFVSLYTISDTRWFLVFRLHTSACDRAAAVGLLRELLEMVGGGRAKAEEEIVQEVGIEDLIPSGKANKPLWARGVDLLGYSLNSFRLANLNFIDANSARHSQVVRLKMNPDDTDRLVAGCKSRGIKLCGALAAAGMIAARSTKPFPDHQKEKYAVVTLIDCRSILEPVLSSNHFGFYHSAILNTHDVTALDEVWELANRCYTSFSNAKNNNKHFSDMNDLNFLMCKAIDNPGLTPSSSMRTAFMSVFEDPVIDESNKLHKEIGLVDYVGCSSVHGIGPTIAIFDTIRDGCLDCTCVYPAPLHSREQMQQLIDSMKRILVDGSINLQTNS